jgi:hypothetical protein
MESLLEHTGCDRPWDPGKPPLGGRQYPARAGGCASLKTRIFPLPFFKRISDVYDEEFQATLDESGGEKDYAAFAENHRY